MAALAPSFARPAQIVVSARFACALIVDENSRARRAVTARSNRHDTRFFSCLKKKNRGVHHRKGYGL